MTKSEALASVPMFDGLPPELIQEILALCVEKTYARGQNLFLQGESAKGLLVIWRGSLKIYKVGETGREQILEVEGPGRSVAELPLFDGLPYPASCAALEDSIVLFMPAAAFHRLLAGKAELARAVISSLSRRLRYMVSLVEEISLKAVRTRLADLIAEMAAGDDTVELQLNNQEIASRIGTVREIVSRTLARMSKEGAIELRGRTLTILDRDRLRGG